MTSNESPAELPWSLPPADIVRKLDELLEDGVPRTILDAGCGQGRNSVYLAGKGHTVVGISDQRSELYTAQESAKNLGAASLKCALLAADIRRLPLRQSFDIVLVNEVLHMMPKTTAQRVLASLQAITKQGGLHVVSGYLVRPGQATTANAARCLKPDELRDAYTAAGWRVLSYEENYLPNQYLGPGRKEIISSRAKIIAERTW